MSATPDLVEVAFRVDAAHAEMAGMHLADFSPGGFRCDPLGDGGTEFAVYLPAGDELTVQSHLARAGVPLAGVRTQLVAGDWAQRWKEHHQSVVVGGMWVGPPWQERDAPAGMRRVVIEPGQGFGTGAHPTTRLMLGFLVELPRASVLDVGCGSGVLAIAAALLGCGPIEAVDNDLAAVQSTRENLARNGLREGAELRVRVLDVLHEDVPRTDIVLANLTAEPLRDLAPRVAAPCVVASGLLRSQVEGCQAAFEARGYVLMERRDRDGWAALMLRRANPAENVMQRGAIS